MHASSTLASSQGPSLKQQQLMSRQSVVISNGCWCSSRTGFMSHCCYVSMETSRSVHKSCLCRHYKIHKLQGLRVWWCSWSAYVNLQWIRDLVNLIQANWIQSLKYLATNSIEGIWLTLWVKIVYWQLKSFYNSCNSRVTNVHICTKGLILPLNYVMSPCSMVMSSNLNNFQKFFTTERELNFQ